MFDKPFIEFSAGPGRLDLRSAPIIVDPDDYKCVHLAVENLSRDLERVTGHPSPVQTRASQRVPVDIAIVVGTVEKSGLVRELSDSDAASQTIGRLGGKWESFCTSLQSSPWPFARSILALVGSDRRGTVFGVYTLSEQIGVSPWHWWADVPVQPREHVFALPITTHHGEPSVKYRGLFINDEAPALTDWVHEKIGSSYNADFYRKFFELLLRMKANFFWPAMWSGFPEPGSSFFADDPDNMLIADEYGIVVSTSHHEPMQRSTTEWRRHGTGPWAWEQNKDAITEFFEAGAQRSRSYECIYTLGMRGEGDGSIESNHPKKTLSEVIDVQRGILQRNHGSEDGVPQVMALYKEVQEYYEDGLQVPDDVTLLFADDNFGNVRRHPTAKERARRGGIGLYYHLEYVGSPRSYKWLNTNSLGKVQQQLQNAHENGVTQIWIFNVGDIKPVEMASTFALALAWDISNVSRAALDEFFRAYATRELGSAVGDEVSQILLGLDRLLALRRHEHIEADTLSVLNYREADSVVKRYAELQSRAETLFEEVPPESKAAFFQLVLHPIKASRIYTELRVTQARNRLYAVQRRNTANVLAQRALSLFDEDWKLSQQFHDNPWSKDKWNHMMKQPRYGYVEGLWRAPSRDMITGLSFVQRHQDSNRIVGQMGIAVEGHEGIRPGLINEESDRTHPSRGDLVPGLTLPTLSPYDAQGRYFEIFTRGTTSICWTAVYSVPWITLTPASGRLLPDDELDQRVEISVLWSSAPCTLRDVVTIDIRSDQGDFEQVHLPIYNFQAPSGFTGLIESDGVVSWVPAAFPLNEAQEKDYQVYPFVGRESAGAIGLASAQIADPASLVYQVLLTSDSPTITLALYFTMVLETNPEASHSYDILVNEIGQCGVPLLDSPARGDLPIGWGKAVQDGVWQRRHVFRGVTSGINQIRYRPRTPGLLLEKIVVDLGGVRTSYLGPPQSYHLPSLVTVA